MIVANQLIKRNRAEYLLYMWQVEDILRLFSSNVDVIEREYLTRFQVPAETLTEMREWYANLCEMMRAEGKTERGHLQINENVIIGLADLNAQLLASEKFPYFKQMYYKVLPYVVQLRAKHAQEHLAATEGASAAGNVQSVENEDADELRLLFEVLYGVMLLRLQQKPITDETALAAKDITAFLGQLSDYWKAEKAGELKFD